MTFKHVFWADAMMFRNHRDRLRFVCIVLTVLFSIVLMCGTTFAKAFTSVSPMVACTFTFFSFLFLFAISFYINTALQGLELTDEWANEGDRDGRYWMEHLFLGNMILLSLFPFLKWVFTQSLFSTEGVFTSSQLLIELPLAYLIFTTMMVGAAYILLCVIMLMADTVLDLVKKEDIFADKKRTLLEAWSTSDTVQKEAVAEKIALVEDAINHYPKLTKKQKEKGKAVIDEMFDYLIDECRASANNKNLLK